MYIFERKNYCTTNNRNIFNNIRSYDYDMWGKKIGGIMLKQRILNILFSFFTMISFSLFLQISFYNILIIMLFFGLIYLLNR